MSDNNNNKAESENKMSEQKIQTMRTMDANQTWKQIPFMDKAAVGARKATLIKNDEGETAGLRFNVLNGNRKTIEIVLHWNDTYTVEFCKYRKAKHGEAEAYQWGISNTKPLHREVVQSVDSVYCDQLGEVVYGLTHGTLHGWEQTDNFKQN